MLDYIKKTSVVKIFNNKVATFLIILILVAFEYSQPYLEFVKEYTCPISWCIFPFCMTSYAYLTIFYFGIIYINSDVPFMQYSNMYQLIRTGRKKWVIGQIGGIFVRSFVIVVISSVVTIIPFLGNLEFSNDWGKVIYTLASQKKLTSQFFLENNLKFQFNYEILDEYSPIQLIGIVILLCTLICSFIGVLMFFLGLFGGKIYSVAGGFAAVLLLFFPQNAPPDLKQKFAYFIPAYWGEVALIATPSGGYYRLPSLSYMFSFLLAIIFIMSLCIFLRIKYIEFNWENEDV